MRLVLVFGLALVALASAGCKPPAPPLPPPLDVWAPLVAELAFMVSEARDIAASVDSHVQPYSIKLDN